MKTTAKKGFALLPALALAAGTVVAIPFATSAPAAATPTVSAAVPAATKGATIDWFADKYDGVGADSVFETATIERFEYLLKKPGKFAFIIGGPDSTTLQNSARYINAAAKAQGISKIYNFNPKLDGGTLNVFDPSGLQLTDAGKTYIGNYGTALVNNYLSKDAETPFSNAHSSDPYLFVYDGSGGDTARITGALTAPVAAADVDTPAEQDAYKAAVTGVLTSGGTLESSSQYDFIAGEHNRRLATRSNSADPAAYDQTKFGSPIFTAADAADGFRVQSLTYPELLHLLNSPGDFALLFGGTWCHNTAAIIHAANQYAQEFGIKKVYNYDFVLNTNDQSASNGSSNLLHIRDNALVSGENRRASYLYGELLNTYLPNAVTQYRTTASEPGSQSVNPVQYYPGGNPAGTLQLAHKIQVGHLLTYNKDHKDAEGNAAPVTNQAIRKIAAGGYLEYMTEWWYVQGKDLPRSNVTLAGNSATASESNLNALENNRAFAKEGIASIKNVLSALAGGYESTVTVDVPASSPIGDALSATVTVTAPDYDGFFSNNGAGGSAVPSTGVKKPAGTVTAWDGGTKVGEGTLDANGVATIAISALVAGDHALTYTYSGSGDGIIKPSTKAQSVTVTKLASPIALDGVSSAVFGSQPTYTATVPAAATGSVTLTGLGAGKDITTAVVNGVASFTLPASTATGAYNLVASYSGDSTYAASSTPAKAINVTASAATVSLSAPASIAFNAGGTVTATVTSGATGTVELTGLGATLSAPVTAGTATFTIPATTAAGSYTLQANYLGDSNYGSASSSTSGLTVTKVGSSLTVAAPATTYGKAGTVTVTVSSGSAPKTGTVTLTGAGAAQTKTVTNGKAIFTLPKTLAVKTYTLTSTYSGDGNVTGSTKAASFKVAKGTVASVAYTLTTKPTSKKTGKATVVVKAPTGLATPTGKVQVVLKKGNTYKSVTVTLSAGKKVVTLPKLAKGTWTVTIKYLGSTTYNARASKAYKISVTK